MKYFLQDSTAEQVEEIMLRLKKLMDGDVSSQMRDCGVTYQMNYGASIVWLKDLAKEYVNNNDLANRLWYRNIRETRILATLIAHPKENIIPMLEGWVKDLKSNEIMEHLGVNLLWRLNCAESLLYKWLNNTSGAKSAAAWTGLAVFMQNGNDLAENNIDKYLFLIEETLASSDKFMQRVQGRFLRQLCRKSTDFLRMVELYINKIEIHQNCQWLIEDVKTEIDFLRGKM